MVVLPSSRAWGLMIFFNWYETKNALTAGTTTTHKETKLSATAEMSFTQFTNADKYGLFSPRDYLKNSVQELLLSLISLATHSLTNSLTHSLNK